MPARIARERLRLYNAGVTWGVDSDLASGWVTIADPAGNLIDLVQFGR